MLCTNWKVQGARHHDDFDRVTPAVLQRWEQPNRLCYKDILSRIACKPPSKPLPCGLTLKQSGVCRYAERNRLERPLISLAWSFPSRHRCVSSAGRRLRRNSPRYASFFRERARLSFFWVGGDSTTSSSGFWGSSFCLENFCEIHFLSSCHAIPPSRWLCTCKVR